MKIKILHIVQTFGVGGMEGRINRLARGLDENLFSIHIVTLRPNENRQLELPDHVHIFHFPIPSGIHLGRLFQLAKYIRQNRFSIVHSHNWATMFYGVLSARLALRPVVFHGEHGINYSDTLGISKKRLMFQILLSKLCHRIIAVNTAMEGYLKKTWHTGNKVVPIMNGVDLRRFKLAVNPPSNPFVFGFMGRLDKVKNIPCIIHAAEMLFKKYGAEAGFKIRIAGEGPEGPYLKKIVKEKSLENLVEFVGDCPHPEKEYVSFSLFINSSYSEGMSNTLLEAMATGLPLIWSDNEGNQSWLNNEADGYSFANDSAENLAEKMDFCLRNRETMKEIGKRNRSRIEKEFDNFYFIKNYKQQYLHYYPQ